LLLARFPESAKVKMTLKNIYVLNEARTTNVPRGDKRMRAGKVLQLCTGAAPLENARAFSSPVRPTHFKAEITII